MKEVMSIFKEEIEPHKALDGFLPALLFQPLRPAMLPKDSIGNALGLVPEDGPLFGNYLPSEQLLRISTPLAIH
jgi:hypothetical protein